MNDMKVIPIEDVIVPIDGEEGFGYMNMFNGNIENYWKPHMFGDNSILIKFTAIVNVAAIDIIFHRNALCSFKVEALGLDNREWINLGVHEFESDNTVPQRVNINQFTTQNIRITFLQFIEDNHVYLIPEISELRILGYYEDERVPPTKIQMPQLSPPKGYTMSSEGMMVKHEKRKQAWIENTSLYQNDIMTLKPNDLVKDARIYEVEFIFSQPPKKDVEFVINIKNEFMRNVFIQKGTKSYKLVLNKLVDNVTAVDFILQTKEPIMFDLKFWSDK